MIDSVINAVTATGTLALAVVAIWGDKIRARLLPRKITLESHNLMGDVNVLTSEGKPLGRVIYYHLKVVNPQRWSAVRNCRVMLMGTSHRGPDGMFHPKRLVVPSQFVWAPASFAPTLATINQEHIVDFGYVVDGDNEFHPALYTTPNNFEGTVKAGEAVRYEIALDAEGYVSEENYVIEVAWDGEWTADLLRMEQHLRIRVVREP